MTYLLVLLVSFSLILPGCESDKEETDDDARPLAVQAAPDQTAHPGATVILFGTVSAAVVKIPESAFWSRLRIGAKRHVKGRRDPSYGRVGEYSPSTGGGKQRDRKVQCSSSGESQLASNSFAACVVD